MAGVYKLDIIETEADLKQRLRSQKTASDKECIQLLSLLKTGQATTIQSVVTLLGRHRVTVQECYVSIAVAVSKLCSLIHPAVGDGKACHPGHRKHSTSACTKVRVSTVTVRFASG
jgi:hypothetical protein